VHGPDYEGDDRPWGAGHPDMTCQLCHGGPADNTFANMAEAHEGMYADPSAFGENGCTQCHDASFAENACDGCHSSAVDANRNSLHTRLWGYKKAIETRCGCTFEGGGFEAEFTAKCAGCHTTCGQCHISRPNSVGGGFPKIGSYSSHLFRGTPHMNEQCTACHGSRIGVDYRGELEGNVPDVHRSEGSMTCEACHTKEEIHGDPSHTEENHYDHRYEVANMPRCEDCHGSLESNSYHDAHVGVAGANLQCQVCHSQPYKNCTNCHNLVEDGKGEKFDIDPSVLQFKIGVNPRTDYRGEYDYVVVRHVPVDPDTYADWGLSLPNYLDEPTWKYSSPHNVIRNAPQSASCGTCHDSEYFLRETDLYEADGVTKLPDYDANLGVVIPDDKTGPKGRTED
jgi:hypothetical protein